MNKVIENIKISYKQARIIPTSHIENDYSECKVNIENPFLSDISKVKEVRVDSPTLFYEVKAEYGDKVYEFDYFQGTGCSRKKNELKKSILGSLIVDSSVVIMNKNITKDSNNYCWCARDYGCDESNVQMFQIYRACLKSYNFLKSCGLKDKDILKEYEEL